MSNLRLDQAVEIKAELEALNYADLKAKFVELGVESVWKAGVKKSVLIQSAIKALEEMPEALVEETEEEGLDSEEEIEEILEEEIDEEIPVEEEIEEEEIEEEEEESYTHTLEGDLNEGEVYTKGPVDLEDEESEEEVEEEAPVEEVEEIETIDEDRYTEEEILENIEIVQCNMVQAIPTTRNFLLRKLDALQKALDRKQAK